MTELTPNQLPDFLPGPEAMLFNSFEYLLVFLPVVVLGYFWLNHFRDGMAGKIWLVLASMFFYGWWSLSYLWLICCSILFNYAVARCLGSIGNGKARWLLAFAISANLALLAYYKYADFFLGNINMLAGTALPLLNIALPLGISFFTFTQIAFLVDVRRGIAREYNLLHYILFVTYFPHLIAGPILHHKEMMPQFSSAITKFVDWKNIQLGLFILGIGLLKKVVLADSLAIAANEGFSSTTPLVFHDAWIASLSYTMQLYFDFSGYCDMAIGVSLMFNIRLPENFNSPYKATDIQDFWRRWHITLSRWLRDYLYIPLGGSRAGFWQGHAALLATFLLGGLWHGASFTFVIWGLLHGLAASAHRFWQHYGNKMPTIIGWLLTFLFVNAAWVFFRADNIPSAIAMLASMAGVNGFHSHGEMIEILKEIFSSGTWSPLNDAEHFPAKKIIFLAAAIIIAWILPNTSEWRDKKIICGCEIKSSLFIGLITGLAIFYMLFLTYSTERFIYFYF